jgi:hypothetical protein
VLDELVYIVARAHSVLASVRWTCARAFSQGMPGRRSTMRRAISSRHARRHSAGSAPRRRRRAGDELSGHFGGLLPVELGGETENVTDSTEDANCRTMPCRGEVVDGHRKRRVSGQSHQKKNATFDAKYFSMRACGSPRSASPRPWSTKSGQAIDAKGPGARITPGKLTVVTLGVADIARSRRFYCEGLRFRASSSSDENIALSKLVT